MLLLTLMVGAPVARADGDPASDYLLSQQTFIPPDVNVPPAYAAQLNAAAREAKARGYEIRVALIGTRYDMGAVTILFEKPKQYARFLGQELSFVYKGRLLVVMPNGLAVSLNGKPQPAEQKVVERIAAPGKDGAVLASTATKAVIQLAASSGNVVPVPPLAASGRTSGSNTNRDRIVIAVAVLAAAALAAAVVLIRRRRAT